MMTSTTLRHILNIDSLTSVATIAPRILPKIAGIESFRPLPTCNIPLRKKATVADRFCISTAIRFVPLAMPIGIPIAINSDIVMTEPPPPKVLIMPTTTPDTNSNIISFTDISLTQIYRHLPTH